MHAIMVCGLAFGDEGKGTIVDYLCRQHDAGLVVRYNGGPQAAHNVVTPDGRHHTFSQFGSGTLAGVPTHLSEYVSIDPVGFYEEARHLTSIGVDDPCESVTMSPKCLVITPYHRAANRIRELLRDHRHGSCGIGYGETIGDAESDPYLALRVGDLRDSAEATRKLSCIRDRKLGYLRDLIADTAPSERKNADVVLNEYMSVSMFDEFLRLCRQMSSDVAFVSDALLSAAMNRAGVTIFEGAQGVLLDEKYGFFPHVTRSRCTFENADRLLASVDCVRTRIGVMRTFLVRHGAGPFPSRHRHLDDLWLRNDHNRWSPWQGAPIAGWFDFVLACYARDCVGTIDKLAITHADIARCVDAITACERYTDKRTDQPIISLPVPEDLQQQITNTETVNAALPHLKIKRIADWPRYIADNVGLPLHIVSSGQTCRDKVTL